MSTGDRAMLPEATTAQTLYPFKAGPLGYWILYSPENPSFDLWFIHGLTGARDLTWTHENRTFGPLEIFSRDFPSARIVTYGYDADIIKFSRTWENASSEDLLGYGVGLAHAMRDTKLNNTNPVYVIPHSLGGLVVEEALLVTLEGDPSLAYLSRAFAGILFLGTPHEGSSLANWASRLRKLIPKRLRSTNKAVLDVLNKDSKVCKKVEADFRVAKAQGSFPNLRLFYFYETIAMPGMTDMVVPYSSAVVKGDEDFSMGLTRTHITMTKFANRQDSEYLKVRGQLQAFLRETSATDELNAQVPEVTSSAPTVPDIGQPAISPSASAPPQPPLAISSPTLSSPRIPTTSAGARSQPSKPPTKSGMNIRGASFKGATISGGTVNAGVEAVGGNKYHYEQHGKYAKQYGMGTVDSLENDEYGGDESETDYGGESSDEEES